MEKRERGEKNERERKDKEAYGGYKANVEVGGVGKKRKIEEEQEKR